MSNIIFYQKDTGGYCSTPCPFNYVTMDGDTIYVNSHDCKTCHKFDRNETLDKNTVVICNHELVFPIKEEEINEDDMLSNNITDPTDKYWKNPILRDL